MLTIDRYVIKKCLPMFFYSLLTFLCLVTVIDLFENLDAILRNKIPLHTLGQYYISFLISYLTDISPISVLLATIIVLGQMMKHNEIITLKASGIHLSRVMLPFLFLGLFTSFAVIVINEIFAPHAQLQRIMIREQYFKDKKNKKSYTRNNIALKSNKSSYFIKEYDLEKKEINNITILKYNDSKDIISRIDAAKAKWTGTGWIFYNGIKREFQDQQTPIMNKFAEEFIVMPETPETFEKTLSPDMMSYKELKEHIAQIEQEGQNANKEKVLMHQKLAAPFANFVVLLLGIPFILRSKKHNLVLGIIMALGIAFVYKCTVVLSISLGNGTLIDPLWAVWLANILFTACGCLLLLKLHL